MKPPATCHVPRCGKAALLYPAGWLCDEHKPTPEEKKRAIEIENSMHEKEKAK